MWLFSQTLLSCVRDNGLDATNERMRQLLLQNRQLTIHWKTQSGESPAQACTLVADTLRAAHAPNFAEEFLARLIFTYSQTICLASRAFD
jgi:hypothetical protein